MRSAVGRCGFYLLLGLLFAARASAQFSPLQTVTSASTTATAVSDLTGDGIPEVVTANAFPPLFASLAVRMRTGTTWTSLGTIGLSPAVAPITIAAGDLNADGIVDLVAGNAFSGSSSVQNVVIGLGTSVAVTSYAVPGAAGVRVFPCDLDGDGDVDILRGAVKMSNDGTGAFPTNAVLSTTGTAGAEAPLVPGDFDGDGDVDLAEKRLGPSGVQMSVLTNGGGGVFAAQPTVVVRPYVNGAEDTSVHAADLNGDGTDDLLFPIVGTAGELRRMLGSSTGLSVVTTVAFPHAATNLAANRHAAIGDFDGDGDPDITVVGTSTAGNGIYTFINDGSGTFAPTLAVAPEFQVAAGSSLAAGDFDADGRADLIVGSITIALSYSIQHCRSTGAFQTGTLQVIANAAQELSVLLPAPQPVIVQALDRNGAPIAGLSLDILERPASLPFVPLLSGFPLVNQATNASGILSFNVTAGPAAGASSVMICPSGETFSAATASFKIRRLAVTSTNGVNYNLSYEHESPNIPLLIVADAPQPPIQTPFGVIATSILSPGPSLAYLDGLGYFGPPNPFVATGATPPTSFPRFDYPFTIPAPLGILLVLQVYAVDPNYTVYPRMFVVSNPLTIAL